MNTPPTSPAPEKAQAASQPPEIPIVDLQQLLGEGREMILMHLGEAYRLRITARDRLILTK